MTIYLLAVLSLCLSIGGIIVRKTYNYVPLHELKRLAKNKDPVASQLYPAVAHQSSLRMLLGIWIGVTTALGFVELSRVAPLWFSLIAVALLLWAAFTWLPASRTSKFGTRLTLLVTPSILWLLNYLHPILSRTASLLHRRHDASSHPHTHTGMFERQDLIALLEQQEHQPDSRLTHEELEIAKRALSFDDFTVSNVLTLRKRIKTVLSTDTLGPILIDELHQSGQNHVVVRESAKGDFVGTLDFKHLDLMHTGMVSDVMNPKVYYVHENDLLSEALHAFFVTNHPVFLVVNSFEEYVGILTVESILKQLLGHIPGDDFDQYADLQAVAARHPKVKKLKKTVEPPSVTDEEVIELPQ